jgi:HD-like signal output (HDOD) protein
LNACVRRIVASEGVPPFAEHANELVARSLDPNGVSAQMASVILKDLGLTLHVLRVANSSLYNRSGKPIIGITHAITLLGWDTVRDLVSALHFIDHYARHSPGLRELMMFSMLTATHSREVAAEVGYPRPEEAYVCGLFRNLGEVLLARHCAQDYATMLLAMKQECITAHAACMRIFGFSFEDLSAALADSWNMPARLRLTMKGGRDVGTAEERSLASVVNYGHEVTSALYRHAGRIEALPSRTLVAPDGSNRQIPKRQLRTIVNQGAEDTKHTFCSLHIAIGTLLLDKQVEQAREILAASEPASVATDFAGLDSAIEAAAAHLESSAFEITDFIQKLLDEMANDCGFRRALFALLTEDRSAIRGRLGSGMHVEDTLRAFHFSLMRGDPVLSSVIERKQDLWINTRTDLRYAASRVVSLFDPAHFLLLPVAVDAIVAGAVYADRRAPLTDAGLRSRVEKVRALIAAGIAKMRLE